MPGPPLEDFAEKAASGNLLEIADVCFYALWQTINFVLEDMYTPDIGGPGSPINLDKPPIRDL